MILDEIVAYKKQKLIGEKSDVPLKALIRQIDLASPTNDFKKKFTNKEGLGIIAEIKKASPSKGIIKKDFCPVEIGRIYTQHQVEAISVLTEDKFFMGSNLYLKEVRQITSLPILRKDFIIDPYQIYKSRALGADAVLLIAGILTKGQLLDFQNIGADLGLESLVEVHNQEELYLALETDAQIIGINNRNLRDFTTDIKNTQDLIRFIPDDKIIISESGIHTKQDMDYLKSLGVNGALIGESLMKSSDIGEKLKELRGETRL